MAATETYFIPYKMASIKWDPAIIRAELFIDVTLKKLSKIFYKRIAGGVLVCEIDTITGSVWFYNSSWPLPNKVNLVKGITEIEIT